MKYIYFKAGKYRIRKTIHGKTQDFGSYPTEDVAEYMVDYLVEHDWIIPPYHIFHLGDSYHVVADMTRYSSSKAQLQYVGNARSLEEAEQLACNPLGEKYLNKISDGYNITKTVKGKSVSYGYFKDHQVAYDMRDYIISCEWQLPTHTNEYLIHIKENQYIIRIQNGKIKLVDNDDLQNIYKTKQSYSISRIVGKQRENYKTYPTLQEAISMRNFLREHNWNKELFKEEYNKRYPPLPEHIYLNNGKYVVRRFWKGMSKTYGQYNTLSEAESRVQYLVDHDWKTHQNINIVNYDGTFYITKNVNIGLVTPFRRFYYASDSREKAEQMLERFKLEGFPEPFLVTNRYRYIIRNRQVYYVFYRGVKLCYTRSLSDAFVARDLCELMGMRVLVPGEYVVDDVVYLVSLNPWGTPFLGRA